MFSLGLSGKSRTELRAAAAASTAVGQARFFQAPGSFSCKSSATHANQGLKRADGGRAACMTYDICVKKTDRWCNAKLTYTQ